MPKIVITAEFDSVAEARNFLAERTSGSVTAATAGAPQVLSQNSGPAVAATNASMTATNGSGSEAPVASAAIVPSSVLVATPASGAAPLSAGPIATTAASPSDPRALCREAMNAYAAKGHDVPQIQALIMEVAGAKGIRYVTDDKLATLTEAFRTRP